MFVLNASLSCIETTDSDIVEIYRSTSPTTAVPPGMKVLPSEAFICSVRSDNGIVPYLAFLNPITSLFSIFVPGEEARNGRSYEELLDVAFTFMKSLGVTMESVNLDYSKALREVVVKSVRVLRVTKEESKTAQGKTTPYRRTGEPSASRRQSDRPGKRVEEIGGKEKTETKSPARVAEEPVPARLAREAAEAERVERERLLAEKAEVEQRAAEQAEAARLAREAVEAERAERERLLAEKAAIEQRAAELAEAARLTREAVEAERAEHERLLEKKILAEQREREHLEAARHELEAAEASREESELFLREMIDAESKASESAREARIAVSKAEAERTDLERLLAGKADAEHRAAEAMEKARRVWEKAEEERVETEQFLAEAAAFHRKAQERAEEVDRLLFRAETVRREGEQGLAEKIAQAQRALERVEGAEQALQRAEADRIGSESFRTGERGPEASEVMESRPEPAALTEKVPAAPCERQIGLPEPVREISGGPEQRKEADLTTGGAEPPPVTDALSKVAASPFDLFPSETEVTFSLDPSLASFGLSRQETIRELCCSSNMARAMMGGYPPQNCSAFLCAAEENGEYRVFIAFFLVESDVVLVYRPDIQPGNEDALKEYVSGGIQFVETIGIVLDKIDLAEGGRLDEVLRRMPALRRVLGFS